jgi:hypothetical protein
MSNTARPVRWARPPARRSRPGGLSRRGGLSHAGGRPRAARRTLVILELGTGTAALAGGVLLAAAPDGSLLHADPGVLAGSPFPDWRAPGMLLATLVGGGFLLAGWWQLADRRHARELSVLAGAGSSRSRPPSWAGLASSPSRQCLPWSGGRHRPGVAQAAGTAVTDGGNRGR